MSERAAVNASPLIYLARADLLDLLQLAGREVWVPTQVAEEILRRGPDDPTARALNGTEWLRAVKPPDVPHEVLAWGLGPGESAVIATCLAHPGCRAVIDDLQGRRCAEALGVPLRGMLGLVLLAKRRSVVPKARPILDRRRAAGMYLSDRMMDTALAEVGE